jgi:hypothetical protein
MARIVFTTLGSWGALFPLPAVARQLREAGHEIAVAVTSAFCREVEGEGLGFRPIGVPLGPAEYARHPVSYGGGCAGQVAGARPGAGAPRRRLTMRHLATVLAAEDDPATRAAAEIACCLGPD